jgi:hypothetical protein
MTDLDLTSLTLLKGGHGSRAEGVCLMEAFAWWRGIDHTDHPACVSPAIGNYGRQLNDCLPDDRRAELAAQAPGLFAAMMDTAGDGKDETRGFIALDFLTRTWLPAWLDLAGLTDDAAGLRAHPRVDTLESAKSAGSLVRKARAHSAAAGDAAGDAAGAAAGDAAWAAAWAAARTAAGDAAGDAAWTAARDAARDAAGAAAWAAARTAAGDAAGAAAWAAARAAARDAARDAAWDAARAAAREFLSPTVAALQEQAIGLFPVLIRGEWPGVWRSRPATG